MNAGRELESLGGHDRDKLFIIIIIEMGLGLGVDGVWLAGAGVLPMGPEVEGSPPRPRASPG